MKISIEKKRKRVTEEVITMDGIVLPEDWDGLFESLIDADGMFNAVVIYSKDLREALEKKGYIGTNSRGGSYGKPKLNKAYAQLLKTLEV